MKPGANDAVAGVNGLFVGTPYKETDCRHFAVANADIPRQAEKTVRR